MAANRSREAAFGDLLVGLLEVRSDPATERFDAELTAAQEDGRIDPQTARVLRWWQRESIRSLVEHARAVVPPTLIALERAARGAGDDVALASRSWERAAGDEAAAARPAAPRRVEEPRSDAGPGSASTADEPGPVLADITEHRRRLLVAGLTNRSSE